MNKVLLSLVLIFLSSVNIYDVILKVSYQFPCGEGDSRDEMVQIQAPQSNYKLSAIL